MLSHFLYTDFSLFNFCFLAPNKPREQREYNLTSGHTSHSAPLSPLLTRAEKHSVSPWLFSPVGGEPPRDFKETSFVQDLRKQSPHSKY